jgi:phosphatidylserine decarboxylase
VQNKKGTKVLFRQIAGFLARRIVCNLKEGTKVTQGEEFGFIKFGSRIDLFLPLESKILVNLKEKVTGGITAVAEIN